MARVFIEADSLTTNELRAALAALSRVKNSGDEMPTSIATQDGDGRAFVGLNGPEKWSLKTIALRPNQAIGITEAIARASWVASGSPDHQNVDLTSRLTPPDHLFGPVDVRALADEEGDK